MNHPPQTCPACKQKFAPGDDIVTCPECGAPYHRACYQKEGGCLFKNKHGLGFEYVDPAAQYQSKTAEKKAEEKGPAAPRQGGPQQGGGQNSMMCRQCGAPNDGHNIFCNRCGAPLHSAAGNMPGMFGPRPGQSGYGPAQNPMQQAMTGELDGIPKQDWAAYIGSSAPTYLFKLSLQQERGTKTGFLLSAFLFGPLYFAYRKMWKLAGITFLLFTALNVPGFMQILSLDGVGFTLSMPENTLMMWAQIASLMLLILRILCGIFGLYAFRVATAKRIKQLQKQTPDTPQYRAALIQKSGPSIVGVMVLVALYVGVVIGGLTFLNIDIVQLNNAMMEDLAKGLYSRLQNLTPRF